MPPAEKGAKAIQSGYLEQAYRQYERGYYENLNHFYAGINALSLLTMMIALAETYPAKWANKFKKQREADAELDAWKERKESLAISVQISIAAEERRLESTGDIDPWLTITAADYVFLTETNVERVAAVYESALLGTQDFHKDAARRQVQIYAQLGILHDNVEAALSAIPDIHSVATQPTHYFLFTGHMIDKPDRKEPRFPPGKETAVREKIKAVLQEEMYESCPKLPRHCRRCLWW